MPLSENFRMVVDTASGRGPKRPRPVHWLSLTELIRTGFTVAQAKSFALFTDQREAMAGNPREFYRLPPPVHARRERDPDEPATDDGAVWVDYVSDTGDGFRATFATARCISGRVRVSADPPGPNCGEPFLEFPGRPRQADLLVLGGDEVYPVGSPTNYRERLNDVLRIAGEIDEVTGLPPVAALPGNHDWYDGLAAFRRNFCESQLNRELRSGLITVPAERDAVGTWGAFQSRSYFAIELRAGWWLWAVDSQLDAPIDMEQLSYFREAAKLAQERDDDRIILCTATPSWIEAQGRQAYVAGPDTPFHTLLWFIERVLGKDEQHRVRLVLTGDEHYYARYIAVPDAAHPIPGPDLVTCGGGGAFLASTHHLGEDITFDPRPWERPDPARTRHYQRRSSFPTIKESRSLGRNRFLSAAVINGASLPLTIGLVDLVVFLSIVLRPPTPIAIPGIGRHISWQFGVAVLALALLLRAYALSGTKELLGHNWRRTRTYALTIGHTGLHALLAWGISTLFGPLLIWGSRPSIALAGYLAAFSCLCLFGMVVFVTYLFLADRIGCHTLEAFSGMHIEGYKSHLRLRITATEVEVWVVGMKRVPWVGGKRDSQLLDVVPTAGLVDHFSVGRDAEPLFGSVP